MTDAGTGRLGRKRSQSALALELLRDGRAHSHNEIAGFMGGHAVNSRVADLRKKGYEISCWSEGRGVYFYRLLAERLLSVVSETPTEGLVAGPSPIAVSAANVAASPATPRADIRPDWSAVSGTGLEHEQDWLERDTLMQLALEEAV